MDYQYPDINDELTVHMINNEYDGEYWAASEERVLAEAIGFVKSLKERTDEKKLLDLGCGKGRLIDVFVDYVDRVVAVEPDEGRYLDAAIEGLNAKSRSGKDVDVINGDLSAVNKEESFDIILSSHVFQHITRDMSLEMMGEFAHRLEEGGLLILTTTHIDGEEDCYFKEGWKLGKRISKEISGDEFDSLFGKENVLPVRFFSEKTMIKMAENAGLAVEKVMCYHYKGHQNVQDDIFAQEKGKSSEARDVMYIFRKKEALIDANIGYKFSFSIFDEETGLRIDDEGELRESIRTRFGQAVFYDEDGADSESVFKDLKTVEGFLHGGGLPFNCFRALLKEYDLAMEGLTVDDSSVLITVFPESDTVQVTMSISVKDMTVDQLVYMRHVQGNGAKFTNKDGRMISIKEIFEEIKGSLGRKVTDIEETYLIEIKRYGSFDDASEIVDKCSRQLYGIMCGDEGFRHVPKALADERMSNCWGSREFIRLIAFGNNSVFLNLSASKTAQAYRGNRKSFDNEFYGDMNPYFLLDSNFAGINHGVFFSVELVMVIKTICNRILRRQGVYYHDRNRNIKEDIRKTKGYRGELLTTLRRVENLSISEIGEMERVILISQQIDPIIEKLKYLLELIESELDLLYQTSTNRLANALAIGGLIFAGIQIVLGIIGLL